jgi:hypothetical protein
MSDINYAKLANVLMIIMAILAVLSAIIVFAYQWTTNKVSENSFNKIEQAQEEAICKIQENTERLNEATNQTIEEIKLKAKTTIESIDKLGEQSNLSTEQIQEQISTKAESTIKIIGELEIKSKEASELIQKQLTQISERSDKLKYGIFNNQMLVALSIRIDSDLHVELYKKEKTLDATVEEYFNSMDYEMLLTRKNTGEKTKRARFKLENLSFTYSDSWPTNGNTFGYVSFEDSQNIYYFTIRATFVFKAIDTDGIEFFKENDDLRLSCKHLVPPPKKEIYDNISTVGASIYISGEPIRLNFEQQNTWHIQPYNYTFFDFTIGKLPF